MTNYLCGKFDVRSFSRYGAIMQTDKQTDADKRFTPTTVSSVSNNEESHTLHEIRYFCPQQIT